MRETKQHTTNIPAQEIKCKKKEKKRRGEDYYFLFLNVEL
jgi:hypothetical protein